MQSSTSRSVINSPILKWAAAAGVAILLAACSPDVEYRGYVAKPGAFNQISNGMSKLEVEGILGSPSTTASIRYKGDSYYYITSVTEGRAFLTPKETSRQVIAIRFDDGERVKSFAQYGLEDGRIIDVSTNQTVVYGEDTSILKQIFKGVGASSAGPMLQRKL
jgi:outer membrane protein assembly factor BamE (lipoprotein component of BamABCDE complex)